MRSKFLYLSIRRSFVGRAWKRDQKGADLMSVDGRPPIVADSVLKSVLAVIHSDDMAKNSHDSSGIRALIQDQQIKENLAHGGNSLVQLPKLTHSTYARVRDRMHLEREPSVGLRLQLAVVLDLRLQTRLVSLQLWLILPRVPWRHS